MSVPAAPAEDMARASRARRIDRELHRLLARPSIQMATVRIENGDGSWSLAGAVGRADDEGAAMTVDRPFHIASIDKICTAVLVLRLHEQDLIDLRSPFAAYLAPTLSERLHVQDGIDRTGEVTVLHLLSHTSGLAGYFEDAPKGGHSFAERIVRENDREWSVEDLLGIVRGGLAPHFPPQPIELRRPRVRYSDTNFLLLGSIVEAVTGQPLAVAAHEQIFRPAGMTRTWFLGRSVPEEPALAPAAVWNGADALERPLVLTSLRSVYSTSADLIRLMRALTSGRLFEREDTFELMQRWHSFGLPRDAASLRLPGWPIQYGLGLMRCRLPLPFRLWRPMPPVVGHTGSIGSWLFYCPERDLYTSGTVSEMSAGAVPFRIVPRLVRIAAQVRA